MKAFFLGLTLFGTVIGCSDPVEELQSLEAQVRQLETIEEDTALAANRHVRRTCEEMRGQRKRCTLQQSPSSAAGSV